MHPQHENPPVVVVGGFLTRNSTSYWGDIQQYFTDDNARQIIIAPVGACSSLHDRACEIFWSLLGGRVDYGAQHALEHGHGRYGRKYAHGLYPKWSEEHPVHFVAHSLGGPTVLKLLSLLQAGFFGPQYTPSLVLSLLSVASPYQGSPIVYLLGASHRADETKLRSFTVGSLISKYIHISSFLHPLLGSSASGGFDFQPDARNLGIWADANTSKLTINENASAASMRIKDGKRRTWGGLFKSMGTLISQLRTSSWADSADSGSYDATLHAAHSRQLAGENALQSSVFYASFTGSITYQDTESVAYGLPGHGPQVPAVHHRPDRRFRGDLMLYVLSKMIGSFSYKLEPVPEHLFEQPQEERPRLEESSVHEERTSLDKKRMSRRRLTMTSAPSVAPIAEEHNAVPIITTPYRPSLEIRPSLDVRKSYESEAFGGVPRRSTSSTSCGSCESGSSGYSSSRCSTPSGCTCSSNGCDDWGTQNSQSFGAGIDISRPSSPAMISIYKTLPSPIAEEDPGIPSPVQLLSFSEEIPKPEDQVQKAETVSMDEISVKKRRRDASIRSSMIGPEVALGLGILSPKAQKVLGVETSAPAKPASGEEKKPEVKKERPSGHFRRWSSTDWYATWASQWTEKKTTPATEEHINEEEDGTQEAWRKLNGLPSPADKKKLRKDLWENDGVVPLFSQSHPAESYGAVASPTVSPSRPTSPSPNASSTWPSKRHSVYLDGNGEAGASKRSSLSLKRRSTLLVSALSRHVRSSSSCSATMSDNESTSSFHTAPQSTSTSSTSLHTAHSVLDHDSHDHIYSRMTTGRGSADHVRIGTLEPGKWHVFHTPGLAHNVLVGGLARYEKQRDAVWHKLAKTIHELDSTRTSAAAV
ncbi:related to lipase [Serendipita indica DSM 11827]|uniref:Related to lipase n=1 Tax=Serendipita indica (strain DSM 11827) TaxID=1109443 RepID=G4U2V2_SERID|nr:related to lipase [Serendipita indica DSM 11827]